MVYFVFSMSSNITPGDLVSWVGIEWSHAGGTWLLVKTLPCFDTVSPLAIYYLCMEYNATTLLTELSWILAQVKVLATYTTDPLPTMVLLQKQVP